MSINTQSLSLSQDVQDALFGEITDDMKRALVACTKTQKKQAEITRFVNFVLDKNIAPHQGCNCPRFTSSGSRKGEYHSSFCGDHPHCEIYRLLRLHQFNKATEYFNTHMASEFGESFKI